MKNYGQVGTVHESVNELPFQNLQKEPVLQYPAKAPLVQALSLYNNVAVQKFDVFIQKVVNPAHVKLGTGEGPLWTIYSKLTVLQLLTGTGEGVGDGVGA